MAVLDCGKCGQIFSSTTKGPCPYCGEKVKIKKI